MSDIKILRLRDYQKKLSEKHSFAVGDLIKWKEGLRNKGIPKSEEPAVVVEVLDRINAHFDEGKDSGTPYFKEKLDLRIGVIDPDDDFVTFWVDSERFEPLVSEED